LGVSRQGEFKNTTKIFLQKLHVENFSQNFDKNFDVSFSSTILFYRVFGCFSAMGVQKHYKKRFTKKIVSKSYYKKFDQNPKPIFSRFVSHVFGRFSVRGVQKHDKKYQKNKSGPGLFLASDSPTHHGGPRFFWFWRPLVCAISKGGR
jgi:hypothetical protein